jgi:hypothetical protein
MYDTLMQMGRWFGYRPGYLDLCRLYMTGELRDWFCHITEASEELRHEFDHMRLINGTPKDYGLKVRSHPEMMVTSSVKMRNGTEVDIDFAGSISETTVFSRSAEILQGNLEAAADLVSSLGPPSAENPVRQRAGREHRWQGASLWSGVPADKVIRFLTDYRTHRESYKVNSQQLAEFVTLKKARDELTAWDVVLLAGDGDGARIGLADTRLTVRSPRKRFASDEDQERRGIYIIRRLIAPRDEAIDLEEKEYAEALGDTIKAWQMDSGRSRRTTPPEIPAGPSIRAVRGRYHRSRGLLLVYALDPATAAVPFAGPIVGFAISFPSSSERVSVRYTVNNVFWQQEYAGEA